MRVVIGLVALFFVGIVAVGAASTPSDVNRAPAPTAGNVYSNDTLARASSMTQGMSVNGPISGHEYHGHTNDEQLRLSSDPEFTNELGVYQQQVDRMLARK